MIKNLSLRVNHPTEEVSPKNGKKFTLEELKAFIGGGYLESVFLGDYILFCDEEGKIKNLPYNDSATQLLSEYGIVDFICGDCLLCHKSMVD